MGKHHRDYYENTVRPQIPIDHNDDICHSIYVDFHHQSHSPQVNIRKEVKNLKVGGQGFQMHRDVQSLVHGSDHVAEHRPGVEVDQQVLYQDG